MTNRLFIFLLSIICIFASCSDDNVEPSRENQDSSWNAIVVAGNVMDAEQHYNTVSLELKNASSEDVFLLSTDSKWLSVISDTLPANGCFDVLPETNNSVESRSAKITLTSRKDGTSCDVEIIQKGSTETNDGSYSDYRIGRGFSCFDEYKSVRSFRKDVLNLARLRDFDGDSSFVSVQEAIRGEIKYEFFSAYSMAEMQSKLTQMTSSSSSFLGFKKTVQRYSFVSRSSTNEQYYAYARMTRIVGSCFMDVGALKYILHNPEIIKTGRLPFSDDFYDCYKNINKASGVDRTKLIKDMLNQYGTHIVVRASLGGSIDLVTTYSRDLVTSLENTSEEVFKTITGTQSSTKSMSYVNSSLNSNYAISIEGGDKERKKQLEDNVKTLSATGTNSLNGSLLSDWISSINSSALYDNEKRDNLGVVDFSFIPIWDLFADQTISKEILTVVTVMEKKKKNVFSDNELGIDNYELSLTSEMMNFDPNANTSLVRVVCANSVPIAEICNEYVPSVRSDKRITVVYPIVNGISRITMGLFLGDGEHRPAYLSFSGSDVYVNPLDGYGTKDRLSKLYYLHGGLYPTDKGIKLASTTLNVKEHQLRFVDSKQSYPVVKIGSGYWTRSDIKEYMDWGYSMYGEFHYTDAMVDGYEYAMIYYTQSEAFMTLNQKVYDNQGHPVNGRDRWYVPRVADMYHLTSYLGHNHKSMLQGQQSGFDAKFLGKCTDIDPETGEELTQIQRLEAGTRCYIVFKNVDTSVTADKVSGASLLVMKPDYTWQILSDDNKDSYREIQGYYYPIRLFRTNYYNYIEYGI